MNKLKLLLILLIIVCFEVKAQIQTAINTNTTEQTTLSKIRENILFNYYIQLLGPSLSSDYQNGATYNRFETGQDYKGDNQDYIASQQLYQSFKLGYKISPLWVVSYSLTFQEDLNKNIRYRLYNKDGSVWKEDTRPQGTSYNNQQVSLFRSNIVNNAIYFISSSFILEIPTTKGSIDSDMQYGLAIAPTLGFYAANPRLSYGIGSYLQRDFYKRNEYYDLCGNTNCEYPTTYQTLKASISPFLNYALTDKLMAKSQLTFDWDQDGNQVGTNKFNANMDDIIQMGLTYALTAKMQIGGALTASLVDASLRKTALLFNFSLNL